MYFNPFPNVCVCGGGGGVGGCAKFLKERKFPTSGFITVFIMMVSDTKGFKDGAQK